MPVKEPIVVTPPREQMVPNFSKEEIEQIAAFVVDKIAKDDPEGNYVSPSELAAELANYLPKTQGARVWVLEGFYDGDPADFNIQGMKEGDILFDPNYVFVGIATTVGFANGSLSVFNAYGMDDGMHNVIISYTGTGGWTYVEQQSGTTLYKHTIGLRKIKCYDSNNDVITSNINILYTIEVLSTSSTSATLKEAYGTYFLEITAILSNYYFFVLANNTTTISNQANGLQVFNNKKDFSASTDALIEDTVISDTVTEL